MRIEQATDGTFSVAGLTFTEEATVSKSAQASYDAKLKYFKWAEANGERAKMPKPPTPKLRAGSSGFSRCTLPDGTACSVQCLIVADE